jgi:Skp family chaperone for outer membrane proteins
MINMAAQKLADLRAGTKEYKDEEQRITTLQSEFTLKIKRKKEELVEHKASLYRQVYGEMQQVVNEITAANNIGLVLQYDGEQINPEKPDDVLRVLGQVVFWHSPDRDITKIVLDALNRGQQMPPAAGPVGFLSPNQPRSAMPQAGYNR